MTDHVGGQNPTVADAASGFAGVSMNTATGAFTAGLSGVAQSIATVNLGSNLNGVDFGFNFDVVVNTNNAGQGSLRQFLINANGLANAGLALVGGAAGIDNAVFMLADGTARPGSHSGYPNLFVGGIATITPTSALPSITDPVVLNGETQAGWSGSPIVELKGTGNAIDGLTVTAGSSTIRGLVIDGFGGNGVVLGDRWLQHDHRELHRDRRQRRVGIGEWQGTASTSTGRATTRSAASRREHATSLPVTTRLESRS